MLSKAIATSFNSPIVTMPGSGFAQTFIGMDVIIVMFLIRKARSLARKWGGTCIVFIDEIDAVGLRRQALQGTYGFRADAPAARGAALLRPVGRADPDRRPRARDAPWRDRLFAAARRARAAGLPRPSCSRRRPHPRLHVPRRRWAAMGGGLALNQLLVQMDGVDEPPFMRKCVTKRFNTFLDALYIVPQQARPPAAAHPAAEAAPRAGLLHRRHQRARSRRSTRR